MATINCTTGGDSTWRSTGSVGATTAGANTLNTGIAANCVDANENGDNFDVEITSTDTITLGAFTLSTMSFAFTSSGTAAASAIVTYRPAIIR